MRFGGEQSLAKLLKRTLNVFWIFGWIMLLPTMFAFLYPIFISYKGIENTIAHIALLCIIFSILYILFQLRKILETVVGEKPFTLSNVARFRSIGYNTLIIGVLLLAKDLYLKGWDTFVILNADDKGIVTNVQVALPFLIGIMALILADIFKLGYKIYEENRLTI